MVFTGSTSQPTEFLFEYDPEEGFDFNKFVKLSVPVMYDYIEDLKNEDITVDDTSVEVDIGDVNYDIEIEQMFRRMQIHKLHRRTGFVFSRNMTYIDVPVEYTNKDHKGRDEFHIGTMPINLVGTIYIYPKGIEILT